MVIFCFASVSLTRYKTSLYKMSLILDTWLLRLPLNISSKFTRLWCTLAQLALLQSLFVRIVLSSRYIFVFTCVLTGKWSEVPIVLNWLHEMMSGSSDEPEIWEAKSTWFVNLCTVSNSSNALATCWFRSRAMIAWMHSCACRRASRRDCRYVRGSRPCHWGAWTRLWGTHVVRLL